MSHIATKILINDLVLMMSIGIYEQEKQVPQRVIINLEALLAESHAHLSDDIADAVSYEVLINEITALSQARHYELVETFAEDIAQMALQDQRIARIKLRVEKPDIIENTRSVGIEIERGR